jgi:hypothetical protein
LESHFPRTAAFLSQWLAAGEPVGSLGILEQGLWTALRQDGGRLLEGLLNDPSRPVPDAQPRPGEENYGRRGVVIPTVFGLIALRRTYLYHETRQQGRYPLDEALRLVDGYSPTLAQWMGRAAACAGSYAAAQEDLRVYAGVEIEARQIQRLVERLGPRLTQWCQQQPEQFNPLAGDIFCVGTDGTGAPMRPKALRGRKGKHPNQKARTREVKVGTIFTHRTPKAGERPLRDHEATSYIADIIPASEFGALLRQEAIRRGLAYARIVVFLGDGARWVWNLARINFPTAVCILDFYHAAEHLHELAQTLYGEGTVKAKQRFRHWRKALLKNKVDAVMAQAEQDLPAQGAARQRTKKQIAYFRRNRSRMQYQTYREAGYFIGSGVVEAGCKSIVGQRFKQSGMRWSVPGARHLLALRCALKSGWFEAFWRHYNSSSTEKMLAA